MRLSSVPPVITFLVARAAPVVIARGPGCRPRSRLASSRPRTTPGPRNFSGVDAVPLVSGLGGPPDVARRRPVLVSVDGRERERVLRRRSRAKRTASQVFDRTRLAAALAAASGGRVEGESTAVPDVRPGEGQPIDHGEPAEPQMEMRSAGSTPAPPATRRPRSGRAPQNSSVSPDGKTGGVHQGLQPLGARARDWPRDAAHDRRDQGFRLRDGQRRAGRTATGRCSRGRRTRSRSRRSSTTVAASRDMYLVSTNVGGAEARRVEVSDAGRQRDLPHQPRDHPPAA